MAQRLVASPSGRFAVTLGFAAALALPAVLFGQGPATAPATAAAAEANPIAVAPPRNGNEEQDPTRPAVKLNADGTENRAFKAKHNGFVRRGEEGPPVDLLFIGDSITEQWKRPENEPIFKQFFGQYQTANFGIGGDQTQHVIWRVENGELGRITPKVIVVLIGTNNIGRTTQQITDGVTAVVRAIQAKAPKSRILLMGIFPRGEDPAADPRVKAVRETFNAVNANLARLDDDNRVEFLDLSSKFLNDDGVLTRQIMPDGLHLSPAGYRIWADEIQPHVDRMMRLDPLPDGTGR